MARQNDVRIRKTRVKTATESSAQREYENDEIESAARSAAERRSQRNRKPKSKKKWIVLAIIVVLVAIVWLRWDIFNPQSVWNWITVSVTGGESGDGFPTEAEGSSVIKMDVVSNQLALLTGNELTIYNKSAGVAYTRNHSFASPILSTAGNHILLAEMGGTRVQIQNLGGNQKEISTQSNIVAADIDENGSFAVATGSSNSHISEVICYNKNGSEKFHWYSSDVLVMGVALRDDGRKMAVIGTLANQGVPESRLLIFDTGSDKEPEKYVGADVLLCNVEFLSSSVVAAVGDTETWTLHLGQKNVSKFTYTDQQLLGCAFSDSQIGLVLQTYGTTGGCDLVGVSKNAEEAFRITEENNYQDVSSSGGGKFFLLTDNHLISCSSAGKTKVKDIEVGGLKVSHAFGGSAIVLGLTTMDRYTF